MLQIDLRELARGPVDTGGELPGTDPLFAGLAAALSEPVRVAGRLQTAGEGRFYWRGSLRTVVAAQCRRCLGAVAVPVAAQVGALFSREPDGAEDAETYPVGPEATEIDLRPAVREELILALPQYVLCREDCRGLCPRCGKDLNAGPCGCPDPGADARWSALAALRDRFRD
ncbi:MAG: YceD family protein [Gemmatimonadales bacterium]